MSTSNRTKVECKVNRGSSESNKLLTSNRTKVECKDNYLKVLESLQ